MADRRSYERSIVRAMTGAADGSDRPLAAGERAALVAAHERRVDALRNSPQYRVGELVIASARSPRRFVRLPVDLWRLRKELVARNRGALTSSQSGPARRRIAVSTILTPITRATLAAEWHQQEMLGEDIATTRPALLFVESAAVTVHEALVSEAIAVASDAGAPTVFWSTTDPDRFDDFAEATKPFEWVFTIDATCVERYVGLGHQRAATLPFAAQPRLHNPVGGPTARLNRAGFAGSWQASRSADAEILLRPALEAGLLDIFEESASDATARGFPPPYDQAMRRSPSYAELPDEYRRYACFLNVDVSTTVPRRVFEQLACRTPVVSTPSRAIEELFGDAVITVETQADAKTAIEDLTGDPEHRDRIGQVGYRAVMSRHTYGHRVNQILNTLGIPAPSPPSAVTVLAPTNRPEYLDRLIGNFSRQHGVTAELIVLTNSARFDRAEVDRRLAEIGGARALHLDESVTMGDCLNAGLAMTDARFIAKFDDDDHYGDHYLHDALLVHRFVDAAIVGKKTFFAYLDGPDETILRFPGNEFVAANRVSGSTMVIDRSVFTDVRFASLNLGEDIDLCEQAIERGLLVFSADRFNYVAVRRRDPSSHSWTINLADYRIGSVPIAPGLALERTMV